MRQIVLDTETTGLSTEDGHRIIEIGCIELRNRRVTEHHFHYYLNPDREIDAGAIEVHGITNERLQNSPRFRDIASELVEFLRGAEVIIHNAPFDVGFLNAELALLGPAWGRLEDYCHVVDTLVMARELHPGQRNSLDALCKRYDIDTTHRALHGALLDAGLLADLFLAMTGGQTDLILDAAAPGTATQAEHLPVAPLNRTYELAVILPTDAELEAHHKRLEAIQKRSGGKCVWLAAAGQS
ncbi:MAG: DNA polymerase III subunit epsilon [Gammaproteobacteria bacterium]|nr:DNA polymerase III subunit epsilon [Gammaproteobacteria bacterium]MBI5617354.1 DNA polymerase III subunit epsilon [Gammaproteobacteria bacterium]